VPLRAQIREFAERGQRPQVAVGAERERIVEHHIRRGGFVLARTEVALEQAPFEVTVRVGPALVLEHGLRRGMMQVLEPERMA
jgi:hypothetical protein